MLILFADDSSIFVHGTDVNMMANNLNVVLQQIYKWINANKLSLNIDKCNCMLFKSSKKLTPSFTLQINNKTIKQVSSLKFLGFVIDSKLSWLHHINYIRKKIVKGIGIICKAKKYLNKDTLYTLLFLHIPLYKLWY